MTAALLLFGYAALLGIAGPWLLLRGWADQAPRLAVAAWQALTVTVVMAVMLGALALAVPASMISANAAHLLEACVLALRSQYATPGGAAVSSVAAVLAITVALRYAYCVTGELARAARERHRHSQALALVAQRNGRLGIMVLDHDVPAAYCLPGRPHRIVLTTAALAALDEGQLAAVLAHERAHLRGRHGLVIAGARALERAFPGVLLFRIARTEIARLVELLADDAATRVAPRLTLAEALLTVADGTRPAGVLAAGSGSATGARIRRLIDEPRPASRRRLVGGFAALAGLLAVPVLLFTGPAVGAMSQDECSGSGDCITQTAPCPPGRHDCMPS